MKRTLQRWWRRRKQWREAQPRLREIQSAITPIVGSDLTFVPGGGRGRDVVCRVMQAGQPVGVLRLTTSQVAPLTADSPFVVLPAREKITRECEAYRKGAATGLTPRLLWQADDANLCSYCSPGRPLMEILQTRESDAWTLLTQTARRLAELHRIGVTHMDASLSNVLATDQGLVFVDFEYGPAPGLSVEQQQLYDYLRLLESTYKFLSPEKIRASTGWFAVFAEVAEPAVKRASLEPLRPALGRMLADPVMGEQIRRALA